MKTGKIIIAVALGLLVMSTMPLAAQSRSETNLYKKTVKSATVKAADKFLKKYPSSVYTAKVQQMKDSLLYMDFVQKNVSLISHEEALSVAEGALDAIGWKKDGKEHVLALQPDFTLRVLSPAGALEETRQLQPYTIRNKTSISQWENLLGVDFLRIHRSFLVNRADTLLTSPDEVSIAGQTIPVSRKYKDDVRILLKSN